MLQTLRIRDFAIIAELELPLAGGFVVFTGETGAGKSIIVDAVQLVLGGRADATAVREGTDTALVEGTFVLAGRGAKVKTAAAEYRCLDKLRRKLEMSPRGERDAARRTEMLAFAIQEIEA